MVVSSGKQGATATIYSGSAKIHWVIFTGDTGQEPTLTIYDNTEASGTAVFFGMVSDENHTLPVVFPKGKEPICHTGIHAVLSAATGDYIIGYEPR